MATFYLKIVTSNKVFFSGRVSVAIVTATDGEKALLFVEKIRKALAEEEIEIRHL